MASEQAEDPHHVYRERGAVLERTGAHRAGHASKSGRSLTYGGREFHPTKNAAKANYFDVATGEHYWISGPRKDGRDRLYEKSALPVEIDADVAEEYWTKMRGNAGTR